MDPQAKTTQQTQTSSRLAYLDILRGMGTLLVLFGHIYLNDAAFRWIYTFHMPLFFFAAGWTYREKPFWIDLKRRVQTILIPYFCFGTLTLGYWLLVERHFRDTGLDLPTAVYGLFAGQYDYLGFNVPLWFLPCFFVLTVFFNLLVRLGGQKLAFGLSALMSLVFLLTPLPSLPWGIDRTFRYIAFFAIGHLLSAHNAGPILQQLYTPVKWGAALGLLGCSIFLSFYYTETGIRWFLNGFVGILAALLLALLLKKNAVLEYLGRISLIALCVQGPIYRVLATLVSIPLQTSTDAVRSNFLLASLLVLMTLVLCILGYKFLDRFAPWAIGKTAKYRPCH